MPRNATLTACIIARDEEARLPDCLRSVAFCDQVVVVDSGSTDRTREIARAAGAVVVENPWPGFARQRNVALDHATGDWVLEVDCDERVSDGLRAELDGMLAAPPARSDIGLLPLRSWFLGRPLGRSAKDHYVARLFRRDAYRHDESRMVHEGLTPLTAPWTAMQPIEHVLAGSLREALTDTARYARLEAEHFAAPAGAGPYVRGIVLRPAFKLAWRLVLAGGWRDGWRGALKIALECGSDALVWALALRKRGSAGQAGAGGHFGSRAARAGAARLIAIAAGPERSAEAARWLAAAVEAGADAVLISDAGPAVADGVRLHRIGRLTPLGVLRALDYEAQLRSIDAVVPFGRRERLALRAVPGTLLAAPLQLSPVVSATAAARRAVAARTGS